MPCKFLAKLNICQYLYSTNVSVHSEGSERLEGKFMTILLIILNINSHTFVKMMKYNIVDNRIGGDKYSEMQEQ